MKKTTLFGIEQGEIRKTSNGRGRVGLALIGFGLFVLILILSLTHITIYNQYRGEIGGMQEITGSVVAEFSENEDAPLFKTSANCGGVVPCNCGDTVISDYILTGDMSCNTPGTTALLIDDDVELNCGGYTISGGDLATYGFYVDGRDVSVKDCKIIDFDNGIYSTNNGINLTVNNTNITSCGEASIFMSSGSSVNSTFTNNIINETDHFGIFLYQQLNNTIKNNLFIDTAGSDDYGVYFSISASFSRGVNVSNNTFNFTSPMNYAIYLNASNMAGNSFWRNTFYETSFNPMNRTDDRITNNNFCVDDDSGAVGNLYLNGSGRHRVIKDCGPAPNIGIYNVDSTQPESIIFTTSNDKNSINFNNIRDAVANVNHSKSIVNISPLINVFTPPYYDLFYLNQIDNLTLEGNGALLKQGGTGTGITIDQCTNITIQNLNFSGFARAINPDSSYSDDTGISSDNITIANNWINGTSCGIYISDDYFDYAKILNNTFIIPAMGGVGMIYALGGDNNTVSGNNFTTDSNGMGYGINFASGEVDEWNVTSNTFNITNPPYYAIALDTIGFINHKFWRNTFDTTAFNLMERTDNRVTNNNFCVDDGSGAVGNLYLNSSGQFRIVKDCGPAPNIGVYNVDPNQPRLVAFTTSNDKNSINFDNIRDAVANVNSTKSIVNLSSAVYTIGPAIYQMDNITLECNGAEILGEGTSYGIVVDEVKNATIQNCNINRWDTGILFDNELSATSEGYNLGSIYILNNNFSHNRVGANITVLENSTFEKNMLYNNTIQLNIANNTASFYNSTILNNSFTILVGLYTDINTTNLTFRNRYGEINYPAFNRTGLALVFSIVSDIVNITENLTMVDKGTHDVLNRTANITIFNITGSGTPTVYYADAGGIFTECPATRCTAPVTSADGYRFNTIGAGGNYSIRFVPVAEPVVTTVKKSAAAAVPPPPPPPPAAPPPPPPPPPPGAAALSAAAAAGMKNKYGRLPARFAEGKDLGLVSVKQDGQTIFSNNMFGAPIKLIQEKESEVEISVQNTMKIAEVKDIKFEIQAPEGIKIISFSPQSLEGLSAEDIVKFKMKLLVVEQMKEEVETIKLLWNATGAYLVKDFEVKIETNLAGGMSKGFASRQWSAVLQGMLLTLLVGTVGFSGLQWFGGKQAGDVFEKIAGVALRDIIADEDTLKRLIKSRMIKKYGKVYVARKLYLKFRHIYPQLRMIKLGQAGIAKAQAINAKYNFGMEFSSLIAFAGRRKFLIKFKVVKGHILTLREIPSHIESELEDIAFVNPFGERISYRSKAIFEPVLKSSKYSAPIIEKIIINLKMGICFEKIRESLLAQRMRQEDIEKHITAVKTELSYLSNFFREILFEVGISRFEDKKIMDDLVFKLAAKGHDKRLIHLVVNGVKNDYNKLFVYLSAHLRKDSFISQLVKDLVKLGWNKKLIDFVLISIAENRRNIERQKSREALKEKIAGFENKIGLEKGISAIRSGEGIIKNELALMQAKLKNELKNKAFSLQELKNSVQELKNKISDKLKNYRIKHPV